MENWNYWTERTYYNDELRDRAKGIKTEMESAKQIAQLVFDKSQKTNSIIDIGCGAGHYILSLEKYLKNNFN